MVYNLRNVRVNKLSKVAVRIVRDTILPEGSAVNSNKPVIDNFIESLFHFMERKYNFDLENIFKITKSVLNKSTDSDLVLFRAAHNAFIGDNPKFECKSLDILLMSYILRSKLVFVADLKYLNLLSGQFDSEIIVYVRPAEKMHTFEIVRTSDIMPIWTGVNSVIKHIKKNRDAHIYISSKSKCG